MPSSIFPKHPTHIQWDLNQGSMLAKLFCGYLHCLELLNSMGMVRYNAGSDKRLPPETVRGSPTPSSVAIPPTAHARKRCAQP